MSRLKNSELCCVGRDLERAAAGLRWLLWVCLGWALLLPQLQAAPVRTEHVTAELVAERSAVLPGETVWVGLRLDHIPHWHTYWRNPGDSGLPTTLDWTLPTGAQVGEIAWPAPKRLPIGPLVNYGFEDELLLPLPFTAPADARPGSTLTLTAQAQWLVCKDVCIPENARLQLSLPVAEAGTTPGGTAAAALFERTRRLQPAPLQGWSARLQHSDTEALLLLERPAGSSASAANPASAAGMVMPMPMPPVAVFPHAEQVVEPAAHSVYRTPAGYAVRLGLLPSAKLPSPFEGVVVAETGLGQPVVWGGDKAAAGFSASLEKVAAVVLPAGAEALATAGQAPVVGAAAAAAGSGASGAELGLWLALLLALLGGMVLNLMPCVFPVLSIKLLGLVQQPDASPAAMRRHALAYSVGVVLTFLALAAGLLALRAAGNAVGWGFQLQDPAVVFVLALLFFVLGLNLAGVFEFGQLLPQGLAQWRSRRPALDAMASGVVAVVAASPCTAPFMGAALGYAVTQSPLQALLVFAALGVGMALPYVALVLLPGWRQRLPRPGAWMLRLKQGLAFPMFATVVWLVWVLGQQAGVDGAAKVLMGLVGVAFGVWWLGLSPGRHLVGRLAGLLLLVGVLAWSWPVEEAAAGAAAGPGGPAGLAEAGWLPYDEAVIASHVAQGKPVFVDFTAAWCVSCQVNKRLVLNTDATRAAFDAAGVVRMQADWTRRDPRITEALARLGRNGVPVYLLLRPGREPLLLPEILTPGAVREALATL